MSPALEFKPNFADAVNRMKRLWDLEEPIDRVPAMIVLPRGPEKKADGTFFGKMDEYLTYQEKTFRDQARVMDERFPVVHPQYGHALISALCGSHIRAEAHTVWSIPIIKDLAQVEELRLDWKNEWGMRLQSDYESLLEWAKGRCTVADYEVEGVSDTMSALRGTQQICIDYYESPEMVGRFAEQVTELLIEFGRWNNKHISGQQPSLEGTMVGWSLWMPKDSITFAEDATVMYSCELYRRFIKEHDRRLSLLFTRTILEVHKEGNRHIRDFGEVEGVSLMVIENPLSMLPEHRDAVRGLLGKKIFLIPVGRSDIEDLLKFTGVRGIMLQISASSPEEAQGIIHDLERLTDKYR